MSKSEDDMIELFKQTVDTQGVACSTVKDGHLLMFKRATLQKFLDDNAGDELIIFIKRPDFKNAN